MMAVWGQSHRAGRRGALKEQCLGKRTSGSEFWHWILAGGDDRHQSVYAKVEISVQSSLKRLLWGSKVIMVNKK